MKEQRLTAKALPPAEVSGDIRHGFVFERVQHVTLKSGLHVQAVGERRSDDQDAAREAIRAADIDLLCILGFAFDPQATGVTAGGQVVVDLRGVDVYDPTTGEVRSNGTSQIALWMIDTSYNEESFFVRHCYFTGGNDPYAARSRRHVGSSLTPIGHRQLRVRALRPAESQGNVLVPVR